MGLSRIDCFDFGNGVGFPLASPVTDPKTSFRDWTLPDTFVLSVHI